jgi:hypothetical protein
VSSRTASSLRAILMVKGKDWYNWILLGSEICKPTSPRPAVPPSLIHIAATIVYRRSVCFALSSSKVLLLARDDAPTQIDVGVTYHASFVTMEDVQGITKVPIAFFKGTADWMFSDSFLDQVTPPHLPMRQQSNE